MKRSALGLFLSISLHQTAVVTSRSASGTTTFTRPICIASSAVYSRLRNHISFALFGPISRLIAVLPYPASKLPTRGPVCPKTPLSAAIVMSQHMCRMWPPPTANPATDATTGLGSRRICICRSSTLSRGTPSAPT